MNSLIENCQVFFLNLLFSVDGGWCEWSSWTPCSKTCGAEWVSRYRSCACPVPVAGGAACPGQQEEHQGLGVQIERQPCPSVTFCPGDKHIYCVIHTSFAQVIYTTNLQILVHMRQQKTSGWVVLLSLKKKLQKNPITNLSLTNITSCLQNLINP